MLMKKCKDCQTEKPFDAFHPDPAYADRHKSRCKICHGKVVSAYRAKRKATASGWASMVIPMIRSRAARKGIECSITAEDLVVPEVCPILNVPFVFGDGSNALAPSVDRMIPSFGYVKGNVSVISQRANRMKTDCLDPDAFRRLADWIEGKRKASSKP